MDTSSLLLQDWLFHLGDIEEAWYKGYDDSSWRKVFVPHDWSVEYPFEKCNSSGTGYVCGGTGWYRCALILPKEWEGKSIRLTFDGVYKNSQVWINSYYLGKRPSGYTGFSYDVTDLVSFGEKNVISVKVTHNDISDSRWFTGSGIYRKVTITATEKVHPKEYGVVFLTRAITPEGDAELSILHKVVNDTAADSDVTVISRLFAEGESEPSCTFEAKTSVPAGGCSEVLLSGTLEKARLWSDVSPERYIMKSFYRTDSGEYLVDCQYVGVRCFEFDGSRGFSLNGVPTVFRGVCVHHDGGALGAAMQRQIWQRRLRELKKAGCNAIRCSHNPHMPELYDLCDAMGFLMMDEAFDEWENAKNKWSRGHNVYPPRHQGYFEDFPAWHEADLRAMVRRDINHPSIILWSIGNEIDYPNDPYAHPSFETMTGNNDANKPAAERQYDPDKPNMDRLIVIAKRLAQIVHEEDDTRPVTLAAAFPELSSKLGLSDCLDVVSFNYKEHLYDEEHEHYPQKAFLGSENGHHKEAWDAVLEKEFVCGQFLWTGIDYLGEAHGWPIHGSGAGLLTTAGFRKKRFYERCGIWRAAGDGCEPSDAPMNSHEFSDAPADDYNLSDAPVSRLDFEVWKEADAISGRSFEEESKERGYIYQILVSAFDKDGVLAGEGHDIMAQVTGAGELVAIDNGDLADLTAFCENHRSTYEGHLAIYVRRLCDGDIAVVLTDRTDEKSYTFCL